MLGKTHLELGYTTILTTYLTQPIITQNPLEFSSYSLGVLFGTLFVDIDSSNSTISKYIPMIRLGNKSNGANHRRLPHTLCFVLLFTLVSLFITYTFLMNQDLYKYLYLFIIGIAIGMISHLVLDTLNPKGIKWFYPICNKRFSIIGILTENSSNNSEENKKKYSYIQRNGEKIIRFSLKSINFLLIIYIILL